VTQLKFLKTLTCLGLTACLPGLALAADPASPYSSLRPGTESKIEAAPTDLDQSLMVRTAAEVVAVDRKARTVTLVLDGRSATIRVGKDVTNLGEIKAGDYLEVTYYEGKQVAILPPGAAEPGTTTDVLQGKDAPVPEVAGKLVTKTAEIVDVDPFKKTVSFRGADGRVREMALGGTDLEHYLKEVKKGDTVQVSFVEAVVLALKPAKR
jgi:hypothetical protein